VNQARVGIGVEASCRTQMSGLAHHGPVEGMIPDVSQILPDESVSQGPVPVQGQFHRSLHVEPAPRTTGCNR
jgi:hypothetical protein